MSGPAALPPEATLGTFMARGYDRRALESACGPSGRAGEEWVRIPEAPLEFRVTRWRSERYTQPFRCLAIDLVGPFNIGSTKSPFRYAMTVIDMFSYWL